MPAQPAGDLHLLLTNAAFAAVERGFLRITGEDATRWLNGMVTNAMQVLQPGEGSYNFLLNAQGRIQGDCTIYREPAADAPAFLLETDADQLEPLQQLLDRFIIMDDVELQALPGLSTILLLGPGAPALLSDAHVAAGIPAPPPLALRQIGDARMITTPAATLVPRFHLTGAAEELQASIADALAHAGAVQASPGALESLRILEARPRYGVDIRNTETAKDLPQETNQAQALHFSKGCYVGQEIVERIRSRGQVHRLLTPLALEGQPVTVPAVLEYAGKPAGELTSATCIATTEGERCVGMGYIRREALATGDALLYAGGSARVRTVGRLD